jgi:hypothetical protein
MIQPTVSTESSAIDLLPSITVLLRAGERRTVF